MNDEIFEVTETWAKVQLASSDAQDVTLSLFNRSTRIIEIFRSDTMPAATEKGSAFLASKGDSYKRTLTNTERLWVRTNTGTADISVNPA